MEDLLEALYLPEPEARRAWNRWRDGLDVDRMPYVCQQLFPALSPSFPVWLENDPAAGIFQGIVRMVWSKNQLLIRKTAELVALLEGAGVQSRIAGPLAWSIAIPGPAIRPIPYLTFLVARDDVGKAVEALIRANWTALDAVPLAHEMDWPDHILFQQDGLYLNLHWRLLAAPPEDAERCEQAFSASCAIRWNGQVFQTTSKEATLLHMLAGQRGSDVFPWQADVALLGTGSVRWAKLRRLALEFSPAALDRLQELRSIRWLEIPALQEGHPSLLHRKFQYFWSQYRIHVYHRKEKLSWPGFAQFLALRWNLPHVWLVPFAGARRMLQHRKGLSRQA